jgi:hypothetical protein
MKLLEVVNEVTRYLCDVVDKDFKKRQRRSILAAECVLEASESIFLITVEAGVIFIENKKDEDCDVYFEDHVSSEEAPFSEDAPRWLVDAEHDTSNNMIVRVTWVMMPGVNVNVSDGDVDTLRHHRFHHVPLITEPVMFERFGACALGGVA